MWSTLRSNELTQRIGRIKETKKLRFTFVPSSENNFINYFPSDLSSDFRGVLDDGVEYIGPSEGITDLDVAIITAHGSDVSSWVWSLREKLPEETLIAVWFWDNHLAHLNNLKSALAVDIVFPCHNYASWYLANPCSILGAHIPLCSSQWTCDEAAQFFELNIGKPRKNNLLVNYVDYSFSWRSQLLKKLHESLPEADVLLMEPGDRSRYFNKSKQDRFEEWLGYKATIILPLDSDLSTRVFDALLAGLVLLVPQNIVDFDLVIPPNIQLELGIIRLHDLELTTIRDAAAEAIRIFDEQGEAGIMARNRFVLDNHMLVHRIKSILDYIKK